MFAPHWLGRNLVHDFCVGLLCHNYDNSTALHRPPAQACGCTLVGRSDLRGRLLSQVRRDLRFCRGHGKRRCLFYKVFFTQRACFSRAGRKKVFVRLRTCDVRTATTVGDPGSGGAGRHWPLVVSKLDHEIRLGRLRNLRRHMFAAGKTHGTSSSS